MSSFKQVSKAQARRHIATDERMERLEEAPVDLTRREDFVTEITNIWTSAQQKFLLIGRYLVKAADTLPHGEFQAMVENELPFGYQVAYQLRMVAEAVDGGKLNGKGELLPPSYATVYQLTTMTEDEIKEAEKAHLIRPTVTRKEIISFKRELRLNRAPSPSRNELLRKECERLEAERDRIQKRLDELYEELSRDAEEVP